MNRQHIDIAGEHAALIIPPELMKQLNLKPGDEVELSVSNGALVVRSISEAERKAAIKSATKKVLEEDAGLLTRLAQ